MHSPATAANEALTPVASEQRVFRWHDHASLWFSLGVGLLGHAGGRVPDACAGHARGADRHRLPAPSLGAGLLGWVAKLGCDSGLASAGLMHAVYGRTLRAACRSCLNIVQLVGWGTFELVVMRDATVAIGSQSGTMAGAALARAGHACCGAAW